MIDIGVESTSQWADRYEPLQQLDVGHAISLHPDVQLPDGALGGVERLPRLPDGVRVVVGKPLRVVRSQEAGDVQAADAGGALQQPGHAEAVVVVDDNVHAAPRPLATYLPCYHNFILRSCSAFHFGAIRIPRRRVQATKSDVSNVTL